MLRQVCRALLLPPAVVYAIVGALAVVQSAGGPDKVWEVVKASSTNALNSKVLQVPDAEMWLNQLEPAFMVLIQHVGVKPKEDQMQKAKAGLQSLKEKVHAVALQCSDSVALQSVKEKLQALAVQCSASLGVQPDIQPASVLLLLWLVTLLVLTMHFLQLVVHVSLLCIRAVIRTVQRFTRRNESSPSEIVEVRQEVRQEVMTAPPAAFVSAEPAMVEQPEPPKLQEDNIFSKQSNAMSQLRRVDSPAKKRQSKKENVQQNEAPLSQQDEIVITKPEPAKKTRGNSKRMASPSPKVEKPRGPENWGDDASSVANCKSAVLLTMLNSANEEMMCEMIQGINAKTAKQILDFRKKNGDLTSLSQLDSVCSKGLAAKILKTN